MAQNTGTLIISTIRPNDSLDNFPVALSNEVKGGLHSYSTFADMDSIPALRRQKGMVVNVTNDTDNQLNASFILQPDLTTWKYLNERYIISFQLENLTNNYIWDILLASSYRFIVDKVYLKSATGTCTATFIVDSILIQDLNALNISTTLQDFTSSDLSNYIAEDQSFKLLVTNVSNDLTSLSVQIELLRVVVLVGSGPIIE
jgi:hypothetical protein